MEQPLSDRHQYQRLVTDDMASELNKPQSPPPPPPYLPVDPENENKKLENFIGNGTAAPPGAVPRD